MRIRNTVFLYGKDTSISFNAYVFRKISQFYVIGTVSILSYPIMLPKGMHVLYTFQNVRIRIFAGILFLKNASIFCSFAGS